MSFLIIDKESELLQCRFDYVRVIVIEVVSTYVNQLSLYLDQLLPG